MDRLIPLPAQGSRNADAGQAMSARLAPGEDVCRRVAFSPAEAARGPARACRLGSRPGGLVESTWTRNPMEDLAAERGSPPRPEVAPCA